jgi:hypothetical protein
MYTVYRIIENIFSKILFRSKCSMRFKFDLGYQLITARLFLFKSH